MTEIFVCAWNYLALMDSASGEYEVINDRYGGIYKSYAAVASNDDNVFVLQQNNDKGSRVWVYDHNLKEEDELYIDDKARDVHDAIWFQDRLWIVCSFHYQNYVYRLNPQDMSFDIWKPEGITSQVDDPHINSMSISSDTIYLMAHNRGKRHSTIWMYDHDLNPKGHINTIGNHCHNICELDDRIYYNLSGGIGLIDTNGEIAMKLEGFIRGLAVNDSEVAVGISEVRTRMERGLGDSCVAVSDRNFEDVSKFPLMNSGNINSIRFRNNDFACIQT